jgi:hypothetical protein
MQQEEPERRGISRATAYLGPDLVYVQATGALSG